MAEAENKRVPSKTAGSYMIIAVSIAAGKAAGLFRDMLVAWLYGTSFKADAFSIATKLPLQLFDVALGAAVSAAFIPVFATSLRDREKSRDFLKSFIMFILIAAGLLTLLLFVFSKQAVVLLAPAMAEETAELSADLLKIVCPILLLAALSYTYISALQSVGEFRIPALVSLFSNAAVIVLILILNPFMDISGLAVSMTAGWALQFFFMMWALKRRGYPVLPAPKKTDGAMKQVFFLALPVLIASWSQPLGTLIATRAASFLGEGSIASLEYASKLYLIAAGILVYAMTNLFFPKLSRVADENKQEADELTAELLKNISLIILPAAALLASLAVPVTSVLYERGEFSPQDTALTSVLLASFCAGMLFFAFSEILIRRFYAGKDSKTPLYASLISIAVNIVSAYAFSRLFGLYGLPFAAALSSLTLCICLFAFSKGKIFMRLLRNPKTLICAVICASAAGIVAFAVYTPLCPAGAGPVAKLMTAALAGCAGIAVYIGGLWILKIPEFATVLDAVCSKFRKGGNDRP